MKSKTWIKRIVGVFLVSLVTNFPAVSADWPHFQGPDQKGISYETGLMEQWPKEGPKILWSVEVGKGFGGVAIFAGKVYMLDRAGDEKDVVRCFDLQSGIEEWKYSYQAPGAINVPGSRSHPAVDQNYVFTLGPFGDFYCFSKEKHQPVWNKNIIKEFESEVPVWAVSQSPAFYKDKVIVAPVGKSTGMVAFNKEDGSIAWKSEPFKGKITYTSPMFAVLEGVAQFMIITTSETISVDANTGKILWRNSDWTCRIPITSPVAIGIDRVFVAGGYGAGAAMLQIKNTAGNFSAVALYKTEKCNCQIQQPILYKDHLYFNGNDKSFRYGLACMDLDGNIKWQTQKSPAFEWGGLLMADGMFYTVDVNGDMCLVKADSSTYQELGRVHVLEGKDLWGTIAFSDGKILLRDQTHLKCVDVKGSQIQ